MAKGMTPAKRHEMRKRDEEMKKARRDVRLGLVKPTKVKKRK